MKLVKNESFIYEIGEPWNLMLGQRLLPENEIDRNALIQLWSFQAIRCWKIEDHLLPWHEASFSDLIEWQHNGFATTRILLKTNNLNPLQELSLVKDAPQILVYWMWLDNHIKACWAATKGKFNTRQTDYASCPIFFRSLV